MDIRGKKFTVVGGAGLIGSHTVEELLKEEVAEVTVFDNFTRGSEENLAEVINDPRLNI
ncbi:MAG: NAD-dependent epimerase/dehydratase family protein, partial [Kordiimonadaceae bacterium]|nr:NAD-dependent epimerase/dehydratase family protein [Kordiimonadaceae bacterium]